MNKTMVIWLGCTLIAHVNIIHAAGPHQQGGEKPKLTKRQKSRVRQYERIAQQVMEKATREQKLALPPSSAQNHPLLQRGRQQSEPFSRGQKRHQQRIRVAIRKAQEAQKAKETATSQSLNPAPIAQAPCLPVQTRRHHKKQPKNVRLAIFNQACAPEPQQDETAIPIPKNLEPAPEAPCLPVQEQSSPQKSPETRRRPNTGALAQLLTRNEEFNTTTQKIQPKEYSGAPQQTSKLPGRGGHIDKNPGQPRW